MYNIVIVGCGATGSHLTTLVSQLALSEERIKSLVLIDGDKIEEKNFKNQKFTNKDVGKYKSRVLANRYSKLGIDVSYVDKFIESEEEIIEIIKDLKGTTILIGSVDNNKARVYMDLAFKSQEIPELIYIDTGNGDKDRCGQTVVGSKKDNIIVSQPLSSYFDIYEEEEEEVNDKYKCSAIEEHPQNFATNVLSATTVFLMISNIVSNRKIGKIFARFDVDKVSISL